MNTTTILTPLELWRQLQRQAGLELKLKGGAPGRDADLEEAVLSALKALRPRAPELRSIEELLKADANAAEPTITTETLLVAVLDSQRGFGDMMQEILDTLVMAEATQPEHALSVEFKFDDLDTPMRMTLEEFRATVRDTRRVLANTGWHMPAKQQRWDLWTAVTHGVQLNPNLIDRGFLPVTSAHSTGDATFDQVLRDVAGVVNEFRSWCRTVDVPRDGIFHKVNNDPLLARDDPRRQPYVEAATDASDYWDSTLLQAMEQLATGVRAGANSAPQLVAAIAPPLKAIPRRSEWVEETYDRLLDMLNLPAWRKRHELYSVWVGALLLRCAASHAPALRFHVVDGVLSFAFGGSLLATYRNANEDMEIWAERRSDLVGTSAKRTTGVQPDFRVVVAGAEPAGPATRLVLECKHYLKPSVQNFVTAAEDYARSCPAADVFLVNHGPGDTDDLTAAVEDPLRARVAFFCETQAQTPQSALLRDAISAKLFPPPPPAPELELKGLDADARCTITLHWDDSLQDMDLALIVFDKDSHAVHHVSFVNRGRSDALPFAVLDNDCQQGPGREEISIYGFHFPLYEVVVQNYSQRGHMGPQTLWCEVAFGVQRLKITCPPLPPHATEWRVGYLDTTTRTIRLPWGHPIG